MQISTPSAHVGDSEFSVRLNPGDDGEPPFAVINLDPQDRLTKLFMETASDCDRLMAAVAKARLLLLGETSEPVADHPFVSPGLVAADRPAPDACMECGLPRAVHPTAEDDAGRAIAAMGRDITAGLDGQGHAGTDA